MPDPRRNDPHADRPQDVMSCMLVSKHWYQVMVPILWHTCLASRVAVVPKNTLERFLPHIRILETGTRFPAVVLQCTRLLDLALSTQLFPDMCMVTSQLPHRNLVRANPGLRTLSWSGRISASLCVLDPKDFEGQNSLESLALLSWIGTRGSLARILRPVATSLTSLKLRCVTSFRGADLMAEDQDGGACEGVVGNSGNNSRGAGNSSQSQAPAGGPLCFPALKNLSYELCWSREVSLELLVGSCPGLESLDFTAREGTKIGPIVKVIRSSCPRLRSLKVGSKLSPTEALILIQSCPSTQSLQELGLVLVRLTEQDRDMYSEILSHASTLKSLNLTVQSSDVCTADYALSLLKTCQELEEFSISVRGYDGLKLLSCLESEPWACRRLKVLCLGVMIPTLSLSTDPAGGVESNTEKDLWLGGQESLDITALENMSATRSGMGWLREHLNRREDRPDLLRRLFKMIERHGLDDLVTVEWNYNVYKRAIEQQ